MLKQGEPKRRGLSNSERRKLLSTRLNELPLKIIDSHLEPAIKQLYVELGNAGIAFKPGTYLSDGWGCPSGIPIIGIPFYLADSVIYQVVNEFIDPAPCDDSELIKYLRHECGHALNYAYKLYKDPDWEKTFGLYSKPYKDNYKAIPFDTRFVRHSPGWYAQKHPDEDFAESFAVWLTPNSRWREIYADTLALPKLLYVEELVQQYGQKTPCVIGGKLDRPLEELDITLARWCRMREREGRKKIALSDIINEDLKRLFPDAAGEPAVNIFQSNSRQLVHNVHDWTGVSRDLLNSLVYELMKRVKALELKVKLDRETRLTMSLAIFISTLAMNYQYSGKFVKND
jgi:hypothetical protein